MRSLFFVVITLVLFIQGPQLAIGQDSGTMDLQRAEKILNEAVRVEKGAIHTDESLGVSFGLPEGWLIMGSAFGERVDEVEKGLYRDSPGSVKDSVEEKPASSLLRLTLMEPIEAGRQPATLAFMTEDVSAGTELSLKSYYEATLRMVGYADGVTLEVVKPLDAKKVGSRWCGFFTFKIETANSGVFLQRYLLFLKGRTAAMIVLNYFDDSYVRIFDSLVESIKFDEKQ